MQPHERVFTPESPCVLATDPDLQSYVDLFERENPITAIYVSNFWDYNNKVQEILGLTLRLRDALMQAARSGGVIEPTTDGKRLIYDRWRVETALALIWSAKKEEEQREIDWRDITPNEWTPIIQRARDGLGPQHKAVAYLKDHKDLKHDRIDAT